MPIDPTIALGIKPFQMPNPLEQYGQFQQIQATMNQNRLADLVFGEKQREAVQNNTLNDLYKNAVGADGTLDRAKVVSGAASSGLGSKIPGIQKSFQDIDKGTADIGKIEADSEKARIETAMKRIEAAGQVFTFVRATPTVENAHAAIDHLARLGVYKPEQAEEQKAKVAANPEMIGHMAEMAVRAALKAKEQLPNYQTRDLGGTTETLAIDPVTNGTKVISTAQKTISPDASARQATANMRLTHGVQGLTPEQNDALFGEYGAVTTGRLDPNRVNSRTAALFADAFIKNPNVDMAKISGDIALGRNATFRQNAMVADVLPEIMQNMVDAGKKVGFSDNRTIGKMQGWVKGEFNDPDMTEYMTQRNDALMTVARVMRGVGMTNMAHKAETEVSSPTMSPAALDAWMRGQMKALQPRLDMNRRITRDQPHGEPASRAPAPSLPAKNSKGWTLQVDAAGNRAYVSPDRKQWEEVK